MSRIDDILQIYVEKLLVMPRQKLRLEFADCIDGNDEKFDRLLKNSEKLGKLGDIHDKNYQLGDKEVSVRRSLCSDFVPLF